MNITRIGWRERQVVLNDRFYVTAYFCRIVLYWTNEVGEDRQRAFFCTSTVSERDAYYQACEYMAAWLRARLIERERRTQKEKA
jgi:hypothetical protein